MATFYSFSDLAKHYNVKPTPQVAKATGQKGKAASLVVAEKCGKKAAILFEFLQGQEAGKPSGPKGAILLTLESLVAATGYDADTVFRTCMALVRNGFAHFTTNGQYLRAA